MKGIEKGEYVFFCSAKRVDPELLVYQKEAENSLYCILSKSENLKWGLGQSPPQLQQHVTVMKGEIHPQNIGGYWKKN